MISLLELDTRRIQWGKFKETFLIPSGRRLREIGDFLKGRMIFKVEEEGVEVFVSLHDMALSCPAPCPTRLLLLLIFKIFYSITLLDSPPSPSLSPSPALTEQFNPLALLASNEPINKPMKRKKKPNWLAILHSDEQNGGFEF